MTADTKRGADRIICLIDEGDEFHVSLSSLRDELALHGLHVVTAADKAVLDIIQGIPTERLEYDACHNVVTWVENLSKAELARREAAK